MRYIKFGLMALVIALICAIGIQGNEDAGKELCCISLIQEDNYSQELAEAFAIRFRELGYRTQIAYCGNDMETQLKQIGSFTAQGASVIAVERVGVYSCYEELFELAREKGCRILVIDSGGKAEHCDIWTKEYSVYQGMRVCEMIQEYLDREYRDAPSKSVDLLLLEMVNNSESVEVCAGYELIGEKFLRVYDVNARTFVHAPGGAVLYCDEGGIERVVEEETGGLLLDESGRAQLNPFYDSRINLHIISGGQVSTNLEAQAAIDRYMNTPEGVNLRIVAATTGDAAIGAAEKLFRYQKSGVLGVGAEKLAVFGKGDTGTMDLVRKSMEGQSLLRGYTTAGSAVSRANGMADMLMNEQEGVYTVVDSTRIKIDDRYHIYGVVTVVGTVGPNPDIFFTRRAAQ